MQWIWSFEVFRAVVMKLLDSQSSEFKDLSFPWQWIEAFRVSEQ